MMISTARFMTRAVLLLLLLTSMSFADTVMCGGGGGKVFNTAIYPLMAYASMATLILIAISYMAGTAMSNAKLTLWAKTELVQLVVSIASVSIILLGVSTFCAIDMKEIAGIFELPGASSMSSINVYDAAKGYLNEAAQYSHNALIVTRYHLEAYTVLSYFNAFICDYSIGRVGLGCLFGMAGETQQPFGGYGADIAAMNVFFNGMIMAHFTTLNFLFILLFIYKGFVFLFLPLGIFLRALPFMRPVGSVLIAIALSFLTVYPLTLAVFYLMGNVLVDRPNYSPSGIDMGDYSENVFPDAANPAAQMAVSTGGEDVVKCVYFAGDRPGCIAAAVLAGGLVSLPDSWFDRQNPVGAITFAADAFIAAVFFPTIALLTAIASVSYMARMMGEEIDLSRITQLV